MKGLARWERFLIQATPVVSLLMVGLLFHFIFPIYSDLGNWVLEDLGSFPFFLWVPIGAILGYILYRISMKKRAMVIAYSKRMVLGLIGWLFLAIIISLLTEEGNLFTRLDKGPFFKAWITLVFILLSVSPTLFGTLSVFTRKRWAIGATVSMVFLLTLSCLIFAQARSSSVLDQDPVLSILFIWGILGYVEGLNWTKRYIDRDTADFPEMGEGKDQTVPLLRRQISYTFVFIGIASLLSYIPVFVVGLMKGSPPGPFSFYEAKTIFGLEVFGLLVLLPLMITAVVRRKMDISRTEKGIGNDVDRPGPL